MPAFTFRKRSFLNAVSTGHTSYILAEVESSHDGEYKGGTHMLTIADCRRRVLLEFFLGTKRARQISIAKINLLIEVLTCFRDALIKEKELIEQFEQAEKNKSRKAKLSDVSEEAETRTGKEAAKKEPS
jgi:hypothetical protein